MPSNSVLEQKKAIVADLVEKIKKAQSGVLVQYQGITVENDTKMRAAFRKAGVDYMVIKNTLIGRACDEVGYGDIKSALNGMTAIAIGYDDPVAPAKIAKEYADKVETFEIKGGFLENAVVDATLPQISSCCLPSCKRGCQPFVQGLSTSAWKLRKTESQSAS